MSSKNEQRYHDALKLITQYQSIAQLRKNSVEEWGLEFEECLEMVYENVKAEAAVAIKGRRRTAGG